MSQEVEVQTQEVQELTNELIERIKSEVKKLTEDKEVFIAWYLSSRLNSGYVYDESDIDRLTDWIASILYNAKNVDKHIHADDLRKFVQYMVSKGFNDVNDFKIIIYESSLAVKAKVVAPTEEAQDYVLWLDEYVNTKVMTKSEFIAFNQLKEQIRQILVAIFTMAKKIAEKLAEQKIAEQQQQQKEDDDSEDE